MRPTRSPGTGVGGPASRTGLVRERLPVGAVEAADGNGAALASSERAATGESISAAYRPAPITWELQLEQLDYSALEELAATLHQTEGNREVQLLLRTVSGQLARLKLHQRGSSVTEDAVRELESRFPFLLRGRR